MWFRSQRSQRLFWIWAAGCVFIFFARPKKTNQKKGRPTIWPCGLPCASRNRRGSIYGTSLCRRSTRRILAAPLQADPSNSCDARRHRRDWRWGFRPLCGAEHRRPLWKWPNGGRQGCRPSGAGPRRARRQTPAKAEERRAPRRGATSGGPFFWFVFFGQAKKMNTQPAARTQNNLCDIWLRNHVRLGLL